MKEPCPVCGEEFRKAKVDDEYPYICQNDACRVVTYRAKKEIKGVRA